MIENFLFTKMVEKLNFDPTDDQVETIHKIADFLTDRNSDSIFLLNGYAGTGKSSLLGALVKTMTELKQKSVLLAPTGRAAKVLAAYSEHPAFTIHKKIYRQRKFSGEAGIFNLMENLHQDTIFIVDEASMISNQSYENSLFGTGRLLDDLIHYVYSGLNCRLLLIGDTAQLPPVGEELSPALNIKEIEGYGLQVQFAEMKQTVRQAETSGILHNATSIREILEIGTTESFPKLALDGFDDLIAINGNELVESLSGAYDKYGIDNTIVISRSNKRTNIYNQGIRNSILFREDELSSGDLLVINKNNYFWTENIEGMDFLANGQIVEVLRVRHTQELYGFRFCDLTVRCAEYETEIDIKIILDTLYSDSPGLSREQSGSLYENIMADYFDLSTKQAKHKRLKTDPFYNAAQVKFAYAITCHKAQGGEWGNVFLDLGGIPDEHLGTGFYRWLYTAFTRAKNKLYLINLPESLRKE